MFCNKCGAEIPEGNSFCNKCGAPVNDAGFTADTVVGPKRSKKKLIITIAAIVVLLAAFTVACFAHPVLNNFVKKTFMSDEDYAKSVLDNNIEKLADDVCDMFSPVYENIDKTAGAIEVKFTPGEQAKELICDFADDEGIDSDYISWIDSVGISSEVEMTDYVWDSTTALTANDTDLISADMMFDFAGEICYINVPELMDTAFGVEFDASDIKRSLASRDEIAYILPERDVVRDIIVRYFKCVSDNVDNVSSRSDTVKVDGVELDATKITVNVDEAMMADVAKSVLRELKNDGEIKKIVESYFEAFETDEDFDELYDEFADEIDDAIANVDDILEEDIDFKLVLWVDNRGDICGFAAEGFKLQCVEDGNETALVVSFEEGGQKVSFEGKSVASGNKKTGKYSVRFGGIDLVDVVAVNNDIKKSENGYYDCTVKISAADGLSDLLDSFGIADEIPSYVLESDLILDINASDKTSKLGIRVDYDGDMFARVDFVTSASNGSASLETPDDYIDVSDFDPEDLADELDLDTIIDNLKDAGAPSKLTNLLKMAAIAG